MYKRSSTLPYRYHHCQVGSHFIKQISLFEAHPFNQITLLQTKCSLLPYQCISRSSMIRATNLTLQLPISTSLIKSHMLIMQLTSLKLSACLSILQASHQLFFTNSQLEFSRTMTSRRFPTVFMTRAGLFQPRALSILTSKLIHC